MEESLGQSHHQEALALTKQHLGHQDALLCRHAAGSLDPLVELILPLAHHRALARALVVVRVTNPSQVHLGDCPDRREAPGRGSLAFQGHQRGCLVLDLEAPLLVGCDSSPRVVDLQGLPLNHQVV